ncbi:serine/threonine-protein kinase [Nocardia sp. NPDC051030]|uniref:serine/threonine-protein kinase n=1 Tax=Nocardia sp. NPDC051030 TaxID=3155162 RepID=UPI003442A393
MSIGLGAVVGGYRIERVLGAGGMGTVYLAKHPELPRWDALKVLSTQYSADHEFRSRFEREANLAATLDHPNIVSVYNRGEDHGQLWIAMQFVDGTDAAQAQERDPRSMTPWRALRIVSEVGRGLDHAHRRGLLHRDIKPANFLLSRDGDEERVLLTDFGVAKSTEDTNELTQAGTFVATIAYASPEQLSGQPLNHRADIYSLACSFFRLTTGRNPYPGTQPAMVMMGHLQEPPPRITAVDPSLPAALDEVLAVAMAKHPADRFESCHEFTSALKSALEYGVSGLSMHTVPHRRPDPATPASQPAQAPIAPAKPAVSRRTWLIGTAATAALALTAGIGVWATQDDSSTPTAINPSSAPKSAAEARTQNPTFSGKTIVVVDISGTSGTSATVSITLKPGPTANFLEDLGFAYNPNFLAKPNDPNPRPITDSIDLYKAMNTNTANGYVLAVRSDTAAGNGGLVNLPTSIASSPATVLILDDPTAVTALRQWTDQSEKILLEKLLPILRKGVK